MPLTLARKAFVSAVFVLAALFGSTRSVFAVNTPQNVRAYAVCQHGSEIPGFMSTRTDFVMWDGVAGAAYYNVYRTNGTPARVNSPPDFIRGTYRGAVFSFPSVSIYTSQASLTVSVGYSVQACDASNVCSAISSTSYAGCSPDINGWCSVLRAGSCKICTSVFPSPPGNFTASTGTSCGGNVNTAWQMSSCADSYLVFRQTGNTLLKSTKNLSETVSGLPAAPAETLFARASNSEDAKISMNSNTAAAAGSSPCLGACVDIGLKVKTDTGTQTICGEFPPTSNSPLRIYKSSGPAGPGVYGIVLVDPSDANASKVRIRTAAAVKALKKI